MCSGSVNSLHYFRIVVNVAGVNVICFWLVSFVVVVCFRFFFPFFCEVRPGVAVLGSWFDISLFIWFNFAGER